MSLSSKYDELMAKYEDLQKRNGVIHFGYPTNISNRLRTPTRLHYDGEKFLITVYGYPCMEVMKDDVFVLFAPPQERSGMTSAWNNVFWAATDLTGVVFKRRMDKRYGKYICYLKTAGGNVPFMQYAVINKRGILCATDFGSIEVEVDKEAVKQFRKKMNSYFKPFAVLTRMGSNAEQIDAHCHLNSMERTDKINKILGRYITTGVASSDPTMEECMIEMIQTSTPNTIDFDLLTAYCFNDLPWIPSRGKFDTPKKLSLIKGAKERLRLTFLRMATKLRYNNYTPEAAYVEHQSMVLQSIGGLRTVPLQGQIEVYRPRSGATKTTSGWQIGTRK